MGTMKLIPQRTFKQDSFLSGISDKEVVKQLEETCNKLAVNEANVELFTKMTRSRVATSDVRSFMESQLGKQNRNRGLNRK